MTVTETVRCAGPTGAVRLAPRQWSPPREAREHRGAPMPVMLRRSVLAALWTVARDATDVMVRSAVAASLRNGRLVAVAGSAYDAALEVAHANGLEDAHARASAISAVTSAFVRCPEGFECDDLVRACESVPALRGLVRSHPGSYVLTVDTALACLLERAVREREIVATRPRPPAARVAGRPVKGKETAHAR